MNKHEIQDPPYQFKPDYAWPAPGSQRECPKCGQSLQLLEQKSTYFGKPWWCPSCQWQFSEEDFAE